MHAKDFYLALILGLAIAQSTYDCLGALGKRFGAERAAGQAWAAVEEALAPHSPPVLSPRVRHFRSHQSPRR